MAERERDNFGGDKRPQHVEHETPQVRSVVHNVGKGHFDSGRREPHDYERGQGVNDNSDPRKADPGRGHDNQGRK